MGGSWSHLRSGQVPLPAIGAIGAGAISGSLVFSHLGSVLNGWQLLALQGLMYAVLALVIRPPTTKTPTPPASPWRGWRRWGWWRAGPAGCWGLAAGW